MPDSEARAPATEPPTWMQTASNRIQVKLLDHTKDPIRSLYLAYRTAYSALTPQQIDERIESKRISREQMIDFIEKRLETGHSSPLEQCWFEFAISGVSRAFSHQFVRHRMGISFEQQSQRYVPFKKGEFPYTIPDSVVRAGFAEKMEEMFDRLGQLYQEMLDAGVPAEDARFLIPNAANTNFKIVVNFQELLHIADLRLCTRAQWEFRKVVSLMRAEIHKKFPELARYLQPKCGERRWGYCDETIEDWQKCPIGRKRPHKKLLFELYDSYRRGELAPLEERDFEIIADVESNV
ncbi:MAG TPA: FAD-dependent thymidylate synthase [Dehalococcoidia bacterium]|nr:FAD-dependent thymidylate synthase [Dehalococcoidia bacterium]